MLPVQAEEGWSGGVAGGGGWGGVACLTSIYDLLGRDIIRGRGGHLNADDTLFYCQYFIVKRLNYSL